MANVNKYNIISVPCIYLLIGLIILFIDRTELNAQSSASFDLELKSAYDLESYDVIEISSDTFIAIVNYMPPGGFYVSRFDMKNKFIRFTSDGIVDSSTFFNDSSAFSRIAPLKDDNEYILSGVQYVNDTFNNILMLRVSNKFQILDTLRFSPTPYGNYLQGMWKTNNKGYLLCGISLVPNVFSSYPWVAKVSSDLSLVLNKITASPKPLATAYNIISFKDKYIHTGFGYLTDPSAGGQFIITDTFFNIDTVKALPNAFWANLSIENANEDSVFLTSGRAPPRDIWKGAADLFVGKWHIRKGFIDSTIFGSYDSLNHECPQGLSYYSNYIFAGGTVNPSYPPDYAQEQSKYLVAKFDTALNLLWQKTVEVEDSYLFLWKILATSDGGCLLTGTKFDYKEHPNTLKRSVYIVKLDSTGKIATIIEEPIVQRNTIQLYPNPAKDWVHLILPDELQEYKTTLQLFDIAGREIPIETIHKNDNHYKINLNGLPSGTYLIHVISGRDHFTKKLIIE